MSFLHRTLPLAAITALAISTATAGTALARPGGDAEIEVDDACTAIDVTSSKDISNVVLRFTDGDTQRFEDLPESRTGTFRGTGGNADEVISTAWVKSGANHSGDGPGYGERFDFDTADCDTEEPETDEPTDDDTDDGYPTGGQADEGDDDGDDGDDGDEPGSESDEPQSDDDGDEPEDEGDDDGDEPEDEGDDDGDRAGPDPTSHPDPDGRDDDGEDQDGADDSDDSDDNEGDDDSDDTEGDDSDDNGEDQDGADDGDDQGDADDDEVEHQVKTSSDVHDPAAEQDDAGDALGEAAAAGDAPDTDEAEVLGAVERRDAEAGVVVAGAEVSRLPNTGAATATLLLLGLGALGTGGTLVRRSRTR